MTLLIVLAGVLAAIVLAAAAPADIEFTASVHGRAVYRVRVRLFFGLITFNAGSGAGRKDGGKPGGGDGGQLGKAINAVQVDGIGKRSWELIRQLSSCVQVKRLALNLTISLGDDYYTGMLAGLAIPLALYLERQFDAEVSLRPAFEEDLLFEGDLFACFRLQPLKAIVPWLVFACSPQYRRAKRLFRGGR